MTTARADIDAIASELIDTRRRLHRRPELSNEERETQRLITERLNELGLEDVRPSAGTGVTALVRGARPGPNLLWRADIDGLPIDEGTGLPFSSENAGVMHACGHDGHVAIALGLARLVQARREALAGTLRFAFQPAEERIGGAKPMIDEGILEEPRVDRVFGLHIIAEQPLGTVSAPAGPVFATATHFRIIIRGRGGHASAPQQTVDPIVTAAHAVVALQTVVSRNTGPEETAVLTVGRIEGGKRGNIIPDEVMMSGSIRTFERRVLDRVLQRADEILAGVTQAFGGEYRFDHSSLPAVVNDAECAAIVQRAAIDLLGADAVLEQRLTGSDDMALFTEARPGCYFLLGGGNIARGIAGPHHHPTFDFDEDCLALGTELALRVVEGASGSALG